ncbi:hypothetical protein [Pelotomaculum propionicicum]|uniref:Uncharacterized protein n=1 Tax=Pelotomaculum propionicicum TaxID=258475 RepID=A0A4Y7RNR9_9FIRM|nr:hypothetical protein [Pelotomaculum propionicicum]TEB10638.1 hypothetical protein Pmgp_02218 [Pelotomaculum propionicicum]
MEFFKELNLKPVRSEPDVWVSRLVIFDQIAPDPVVIRDVPLTRGLNIIWAEEAEDDSSPAEITGHSAGKTTFCRLLRYVLGEKTFGTKATMELIRSAFPNGYVAAELHVRGQRWAVRRPFGSGRMSYIKEDASIEDLLMQRGRSVTQESYTQKIGLENLLDQLETGGIVQTGELIQWLHILAWCTRDQETRFQNIHDWRSPRSEADTPSFRFPKAGPLFLMRTVLGLFLPGELKGEERVAELQRKKDRLTKELEDKRREPQFRVNLYDYQLRQSLKSLLPNEADIDSQPFRSGVLFPDDLERLTARVRKKLKESFEKTEQEIIALQMQIDDLGSDFRRQEETLARLEALFAQDTAKSLELDDGLSKRAEQRKNIEKFKDGKCPFGDVLIRECRYIQERQRILQLTELQDARAMEQAEARCVEERRRIDEEKAHLQESIKLISEERQSALKKRDALQAYTREQHELLRDLERTYSELAAWIQKRDRLDGYEELDLLRRELDTTGSEIAKIEKELAELLRQHDHNRGLLDSIFSGIVRCVLSSGNYDGKVGLENRELSFRITHGPAMTGEAVETLSVLLADLSCLIYSSVIRTAHLPGFLMHDSPREADLGIRLYRSFIRAVANLQENFGSPDSCPFQYVITTTTSPPPELNTDQYVKLRLNAARTEELLLRANIAMPRQQNQNVSLWE